MAKRFSTQYPGIKYVKQGKDKHYFAIFKRPGEKKQHEIMVGKQSEKMTAFRASAERAAYIKGRPTPREIALEMRDNLKTKTFSTLFDDYIEQRRRPNLSTANDVYRFNKHLRPIIGNIEPRHFTERHISAIAKRIRKELSPQTQKHIWGLVIRVSNHDIRVSSHGDEAGIHRSVILKIHDATPHPNNDTVNKNEVMNAKQRKAFLELLDAKEEAEDKATVTAARMMRLAFHTGMRKGETLKLKWHDINFDLKTLEIVAPKGGKDALIPLNDTVLQFLKLLKEESDSESGSGLVFPIPVSKRTVERRAKEIREEAGLPDDFRPFHGCRVNFASTLAASGKVQLDTIQKLLTHKDLRMTQRYRHLPDEILRDASNVFADMC